MCFQIYRFIRLFGLSKVCKIFINPEEFITARNCRYQVCSWFTGIDGSEEIHKKMIANECQFRLTHRISCHKKIQFICVEIHNTKSSNSIESEPSWEVVWNCQNPHSISFAYLNLRTCTSWNCSSPSYACRI